MANPIVFDLLSPFLLLLLLVTPSYDAVPNLTERIVRLLTAARERGHITPVLSPMDGMLQGPNALDTAAVQRAGFPVVVWTVNDPQRMRALLKIGVDGIISDRPDLLRKEAGSASKRIDVEGHRGGRDLRPENTLPAFESGLDNLITTIETDTGVTRDHFSLISHEQFLNPQTCRAADGSPYAEANKIWIRDIEMAEAAKRFICDKTFRGPQQKNDLALSPVAVAYAREHGMISPYAPTSAGQLFDFVAFYVTYYRHGSGRSNPAAEVRAANAEKVRFNLETKITPQAEREGHTFSAEVFTETLASTIRAHHMEARADIQSFNFRTLELVERRFPQIRTVYLMENAQALQQVPEP